MARNRYLTRWDFRQYLVAHPYTAMVPRSAELCPVSLFLAEETQRTWHTSPLACVPQVDAEVEVHEFRPPRWARDFIHALDKEFKDGEPIIGQQALYILDEAVV